MTSKPLIAAFAIAVLAMAVLAGPAGATVYATKNAEGKVTKFTAGQSETYKVSKKSEKISLENTIGGTTLVLQATGIEGVETKIEQSGTGEAGIAKGSGKLKLTGATIVSLPKCHVESTLTSNPLVSEIVMGTGTVTYDKFTAAAGETAAIIEFTLTGSECALAGKYKITGNAYGEVSATASYSSPQVTKFSKTVQEAGQAAFPGLKHLGTFGSQGWLAGETNSELSGSLASRPWAWLTS